MDIDWQSIATGALIVTLGILSWIGERQVKRIDELERKDVATKADVAVLRQELREDMREHREETRKSFQRTFERLDVIIDRNGGAP
jgi:hypothetical protein